MSMATVEIRAQGIVGKQALPPPRRECLNIACRMQADPLEHVDQVGVGIDPMQPAGGYSRVWIRA